MLKVGNLIQDAVELFEGQHALKVAGYAHPCGTEGTFQITAANGVDENLLGKGHSAVKEVFGNPFFEWIVFHGSVQGRRELLHLSTSPRFRCK